MKLIKYFIFSFLLLPVVVLSQINNPGFTIIDTYDLFKGTTWADSIKVAAAKIGNYRVAYLASDSSANSALTDSVFTSNPINTTTGNIQVVIKADSVNYDFGVMSAIVEYGCYRGPNYSADGYEWNTIATITDSMVSKVNITSQSWNQTEEYMTFKYRITETGQQANKYYIFHQMKGRRE